MFKWSINKALDGDDELNLNEAKYVLTEAWNELYEEGILIDKKEE
jgi:hypothetical protein